MTDRHYDIEAVRAVREMVRSAGKATTALRKGLCSIFVGSPDYPSISISIAMALDGSIDAAVALVERVLPDIYWLLGRGRIRPTEPLYGFHLLEGNTAVVAETEHEIRELAILDALLSAIITRAERAQREEA